MSTVKYFPTVENIDQASTVLSEILEPTPFQRNADLSVKYNADVFLKREDLQVVRSYKIRGAYNKIRSIKPEDLKNGIVCASAGNHAQGVAFSCNKLKIMGSIYMPTTTPKQKIEQVKMFGGNSIAVYNPEIKKKVNVARKLLRQHRVNFITPADYTKESFTYKVVCAIIDKIKADWQLAGLSR